MVTLERSSTALTLLVALSLLGNDLTALGQSTVAVGTPSTLQARTTQTTLQGNATRNTKSKPSSLQQARIQRASTRRSVHTVYRQPRTFWQRHPMIKDAAIGGGVGAAAGGVTGLISHRGIMHGALVGAGAGAGVGAIHASKTMRRHPYMRDAAEGGVAGLGLGLAASRGSGAPLAGAGIGAAAGLGYRFFKNNMR
jgi:cell wall-associated NlpC family hydrolase